MSVAVLAGLWASGCIAGVQVEVCDGIDNDSDGEVDNIPRSDGVWFLDADGDGFGDPAIPRCADARGAVDNELDCDDGSADVHPGRTEICAAGPPRDDDCDPSTEDPLASVGAEPFDDLALAIAHGSPGDRTVTVCDGNAVAVSAIAITGNVTVRSASGTPKGAVLQGQGGRMFELEDELSALTLEGLRVRNGFGDTGGVVSAGRRVKNDVTLFGWVTLRHVLAEGNVAGFGGGVVAADRVVVEDSEFRDNHADEWGGAILANQATLTNASFTGGTADFGGAVFTFEVTTSSSSTFTMLDASRLGGAVFAQGGMRSTGDRFEGNEALVGGGAVRVEATSVFSESLFVDNTAEWGGALGAHNMATAPDQKLTLSGSTFERNTATLWGGAILLDSFPEVEARKAVFDSNRAFNVKKPQSGWGGAVNANTVDGLTWVGGTFVDNRAGASAGGFLASCTGAADYTMDEVTFTENSAEYGGGLYVNTDCGAAVARSTFTANHAVMTGGAIFLGSGAQGDLSASTLTDNTATLAAAAYLAGSSHLAIRDSVVLRNQTSAPDSGAVHLLELIATSVIPTLEVLRTDFGDLNDKEEDNGAFDVVLGSFDPIAEGYEWAENQYGDDASFNCDYDGCD